MPMPAPDHGLLSLLPPLVALALALFTRRVLLSLLLGVLSGFIVLAGGDPLRALLSLFERGLFAQLGKPSNASLVIVLLIISGFIGVLDKSGGLRTFARRIAAGVRGSAGAQLTTWLAGIGIFFSDSATPLILGPIFRPVLDGVGVSRAKLAYILDSTASPVCVLVPFISWGVYIMSLIEQAHRQLGVKADAFDTFVALWPLSFYPVLALLAVPLTILMRRELGPMATAQRALHDTPPGGDSDVEGQQSAPGPDAADASARVVTIPLATLGLVVTALFVRAWVVDGKLGGTALKTSLAVAYLVASLVAIELCARDGVLSRAQAAQGFRHGVQRTLVIPLILLLAWSLSDVCKALGTGRFVARLTRGGMSPGVLSAAIFLVAAVISFAMGSAYGTYAILIPIGASLAHRMGASLHPPFAAVLSGGLFGDHASPISDTTILASMGADCPHIEHVRTQLPYALTCALVALAAFYLAGRGAGAWLMPAAIVTLVVLLGGLLWRFGEPLHARPDGDGA